MTFIVPPQFVVNGVSQRERPPCVIECDVVELVKSVVPSYWHFKYRKRVAARIAYTAYVRLPEHVEAPADWTRLSCGAVELTVPLHFNRRVDFPTFAPGQTRVRLDEPNEAMR